MDKLPYIIIAVYIFIIGMCTGSFLNVVIYRVPLGISVAKGRSFCPKCGHSLSYKDLVPLFSWVFLKRKCRYCKEPISGRYALVEVLGGVFALMSYLRFGFNIWTVFSFMAVMVLTAIAFIDFDTLEIPNGLTLCIIIPIIFSIILYPQVSIPDRVAGFFIVSVPMLIITLIIPDSFGGGDIKLIAVCGVLLGAKNVILATFIALLFGGAYGIWLLKSQKAGRKSHFAFGPFLSIGITVALFWGEQIINRYLSIFI